MAESRTRKKSDASPRTTPGATSPHTTSGTAPRILVGTSGFSFPEWTPLFYPQDLPSKKFLSFYAQHFETTEINNTFYRIPRPALTRGWYDEVLEGALGLREKLGAVLVQPPPNFSKDVELLRDFAASYRARARLAIEFRHESWFEDEVYEVLRQNDCALAVVEKEEAGDLPPVRQATASFVYMRLRKPE